MFGQKTDGLFSFDDAAKAASTAGKWKNRIFKLSSLAANWDDLYDAAGELSLIEILLRVISPRAKFTPEGGFAIRMTNKTGANTVKGSVVEVSDDRTTDNAVGLSEANDIHPIGIMYDNGVADGSECWVVVSGRCQVLLKDGISGIRGYWLGTSDTTGRAQCKADPASQSEHMQEIGHCMEYMASGTGVLAYAVLHFN